MKTGALGDIKPIEESEILASSAAPNPSAPGTILGMDNLTQIKWLLAILVLLSLVQTFKSDK